MRLSLAASATTMVYSTTFRPRDGYSKKCTIFLPSTGFVCLCLPETTIQYYIRKTRLIVNSSQSKEVYTLSTVLYIYILQKGENLPLKTVKKSPGMTDSAEENILAR
jgi:hypothetical protein